VQETIGDQIATWLTGAALFVLALFFVWPTFNRMSGEVTVYRMFCKTNRVKDECPLKEEQTSITETYKVFPDQQSVIYWINDSAPLKFTNCAVRDALNWRCTTAEKRGDAPTEYSMVNGDFSETVDGVPVPGDLLFYQTPRWRWWLVHFRGMLPG